MPIPLIAQRRGSDVEVTGLPELPRWRVLVHATGGVTITPAPGERLSAPNLRRIPIGAVMAAADAITVQDRIATASADVHGWTEPVWVPSHQRDVLVRNAYRAALRHGLSPRLLIGHLWNISDQKAGEWLTEMRTRQAIGSRETERAAMGL